MVAASHENEPTNPARRRLLSALIAGSGSALVLPRQWTKPVIDQVFMPAHAQATAPYAADGTYSGRLENLQTDLNINVAGDDAVVTADRDSFVPAEGTTNVDRTNDQLSDISLEIDGKGPLIITLSEMSFEEGPAITGRADSSTDEEEDVFVLNKSQNNSG